MLKYDYNNSIVRMERVWEEFDLGISNHDSGPELDAWDTPNEVEGAEGEGAGVNVGSVLGEAPIQEGEDILHSLREENG